MFVYYNSVMLVPSFLIISHHVMISLSQRPLPSPAYGISLD